MKLYYWDRPYHVPYGASAVVVMAENIKQAREKALKSSNGGWHGRNLEEILKCQGEKLGRPKVFSKAKALHFKWEE